MTEQPERPDTHAMASYIKRLMKRDGQQDWADGVLDWDERGNFVKSLMERNLDPEEQLEQINPEKRDYNNFVPQRLMKKDVEGFAPQRLMKKDLEGFVPQRLMKKDIDGFVPQRLMKKDLEGFAPKRLMKKNASFGPRRLMKKDDYEQNGFSTLRLMKRQFDNNQSFGPKRLMKKRDLDGFDIERLTKRDFDPKRLMKKELWSTRLIRRKEERPGLTSLRLLELPVESEIWEPIAEVQEEPQQGHWRIEW